MGTVHQKFTGDAKQLEAEYQKLLAQQVKQEEQLRKVKLAAEDVARESKTLAGVIRGSANSIAQSVDGSIAKYISLQEAISRVIDVAKSEHEYHKALAEQSLETSIRVAKSQATLEINLGGQISAQERSQFRDVLADIRQESNFSEIAPLNNAAAGLISTTSKNLQATEDVLREVAPLFVHNPEDLPEASNAVAKLMIATGTSAKESTTMMVSAFGESSVNQLAGLKNIPKGVIAAMATQPNIDPKEAAKQGLALFAAFGNQLTDSEGNITSTAANAAALALERNFPDLNSIKERLAAAQEVGERVASSGKQKADPKDLAILEDLIKTGFEGPAKVVARNLFGSDQNKVQASFDQSYKGIVSTGDSVDRLREIIQGGTDQLFYSTRTGSLEGQIEEALLNGESGARAFSAANVRKALTQQDMVGSSFVNAFDMFMLETLSPERHLELLKARQSKVLRGSLFDNKIFGFGENPERPRNQLNDTERGDLNVIETAINNILELFERQRKQGGAAAQARAHDERD